MDTRTLTDLCVHITYPHPCTRRRVGLMGTVSLKDLAGGSARSLCLLMAVLDPEGLGGELGQAVWDPVFHMNPPSTPPPHWGPSPRNRSLSELCNL